MPHADLPFEQARNAEYLARLKEKLERPIEYTVARSRSWVDPHPAHGRTYDVMEPLIGRVGLDSDHEDLGRSFYVGARHIECGDLRVFSWAAPVADLFFQPDGGACRQVDVAEVVVRRSFVSHVDTVTDLADEWVRHLDPSPFTAAGLAVPAPAPSTRRRSPPDSAPSAEPSTADDEPMEPDADAPPPVPPAAEPERSDARDVLAPALPPELAAGMRSPDLVLKRLAEPRSHRLASVLASLQPDQHELVSHRSDESLLVQGHPGTGKTIVAAYRAAYLVHPDRRSERVREVMLIGPTGDYVNHVEGLLRPMDPAGRVVVTHLAELMSRTVGAHSPWSGGIGGEHDDVDAMAGGLASLAVRELQRTGRLKSGTNVRRANIQAVYEMVAANGSPDRPLSAVADQALWMSKLPPFDRAFQLRRYLPLMAQCALAIQPTPPTDRFEHIVVDEAQDVSPIEWNVLDQFLSSGGHWTLVGDMNQRRSDISYADWGGIADHLVLGDGDTPLVPRVMARGYRSTGPILRFADKLLPRAQRGAMSIQLAGPPVRREPTRSAAELTARAVAVAGELIDSYPDGSIALLTVDPGSLISELGKQGWRRGADHSSWSLSGRTVRLLVPEAARGLEFDAVVVVEPAAFPENLGRAGQLYTSLTRANRELAVVWHRPLPDALRSAGRR